MFNLKKKSNIIQVTDLLVKAINVRVTSESITISVNCLVVGCNTIYD